MLLRWWKEKNSQQLAGLDIKSDAVNILKINIASKPYQVEVYASAPLAKDAVQKNEIKDTAAVGNAIKKLLKSIDSRIGSVALSVPRASVITKTISVNSHLNSAEIESRAWIEANHHFPDLVGEIYLDFSVIGPSAENPSDIDLMLVACRKDQIKPYLDALKEGGLKAEVIDVNSYALEKALSLVTENFPQSNTFALLNLDSNLSSLVVSHEGDVIFAHDHIYDDHKLSSQIQTYLTPENKDANKIASLEDAGYVNILKNTLTSHLRHIMHFFYSSRANINIQKLYLSGDFSNLPDLANFIQQEIGIETSLANPFDKMIFSSSVDKKQLEKNSSSLMLCCGLALTKDTSLGKTSINLLPWREKARKKKQLAFLALLGIFIGITFFIIFLTHIYYDALINRANGRVQYLQEALGQKQQEYSHFIEKKKQQTAIETNLKFITSLHEKNFQAVRMLNELVLLVPKTITLQKLVRKGNQILIEGKAQSELQVTQFIKNISNSTMFNQPLLTHINAPLSDTETGKIFQLKIEQKDQMPP